MSEFAPGLGKWRPRTQVVVVVCVASRSPTCVAWSELLAALRVPPARAAPKAAPTMTTTPFSDAQLDAIIAAQEAEEATGAPSREEAGLNEAAQTFVNNHVPGLAEKISAEWDEKAREDAKKKGPNEPVHQGGGDVPADWEAEERSFIFERRLERAVQLKEVGNGHFRAAEWDAALRRYKKALYHSECDQLQTMDLMDHHREQLFDVQVPVKLNLAACLLKIAEAAQAGGSGGGGGGSGDVEGGGGGAASEGGGGAASEGGGGGAASEGGGGGRPGRGGARAGGGGAGVQRGAQDAPEECEGALPEGAGTCSASTSTARRSASTPRRSSRSTRTRRRRAPLDRKLRALRREERARARELYGGLIQPKATYAAAAAAAERHARWRGRAVGAARAVALPVVVPLRWLGRLLDAIVWQPLCAAAEWVAERAAARVEHTMGLHHVRAREAAHHANKKYD